MLEHADVAERVADAVLVQQHRRQAGPQFDPALVVPDPRRTLVICFGMGTSYRTALNWNIDTTAVELVPGVPDGMIDSQIGVSIRPGWTEFTRPPSLALAHSMAIDLVKSRTPPLVAQ